MAAKVTLGGKLPGDDRNGLAAFYKDLIEHPTEQHVMIAVVDVNKVVTQYEDGDAYESPQLRIRRVEIITKGDMPHAQRLLQRAWEERSGTEQLPLELEDDLKLIFAGYDALAATDDDGKPKPTGSSLPDFPPTDAPTDTGSDDDGDSFGGSVGDPFGDD